MKQSKIIFGRIKHIYSYHSYNINSYIIQVLSTTSEYHIGVRYYQINPCAAICCVSVNIFQVPVNGKVFKIAFQISYPELTEGQVKALHTKLTRWGWLKKNPMQYFSNFLLVFYYRLFKVCSDCHGTMSCFIFRSLFKQKEKRKIISNTPLKKLANILQQHGQIMYFCLMLGTSLIYAFVPTQSPGTLIWSVSNVQAYIICQRKHHK